MSDTSRAHVAFALARVQGPAAAFAAPALATDGIDIASALSGTASNIAWLSDRYLRLKAGPKRGLLFLSSDAVTAVTNGQIYFYAPDVAGGKWFSIGLIYTTGAASLTATAGALVEFSLPAAATRLAFAGTLSAGNVIATFVPVWDEI